jgi:hypothetical protein
MNEAIELHDATLAKAERVGGDVVLSLAPAYVHRSEGQPGIDPGTGWLQPFEVTLLDAVTDGALPEEAAWVSGGSVRLGGETYENEIPIPVPEALGVEMALVLATGAQVRISAGSIRVRALGEATYVEDFSP